MKKIIFSIFLLTLIGSAFAAENPIYEASVDVLMDAYGPGDTLTIYGFIDHTTGSGTSPLSSLTLRYYKVGSDPESNAENINDVQYASDFENTDDLLLDGAYYATKSLSGMSQGTYTVQIMINGDIKDSVQFDYDDSTERNSTFTVSSSYISAGSLNADYIIEKENTLMDMEYTVNFYSPTIDGLGAKDYQDSLLVDIENSSATSVSYTSPFSAGANILVAKVTSAVNDSTEYPEMIPLPYIRLWSVGTQSEITSSGVLTLESCSAKEETSTECSFTVENNGDYPSSYLINAESDLSASISFTDDLIQPGETKTGTLLLTAVEGDSPSKTLTLELLHASQVLDTVSETITVETRDLVNEVIITDFEVLPTDARPGDEATMSFKVCNTGDFNERVRIQYQLSDGTPINHGTLHTLSSGQNWSTSVSFTIPETEELSLTLNVLDESESFLAGRVTTIYVEPFLFTPYARWNHQYRYIEQASNDTNTLTVRNDGNTAEYFDILVQNSYASLDKRVYLTPGQQTSIEVPIIVSESASIGTESVNVSVCSLSSLECDTDDFTLTVLEMNRDNSTIVVNNELQELSDEQGAVFEIVVQNYQGATKTYSLSVGAFQGELQVSPSTLTLMDDQEGVFYVHANPENQVTQDLTYEVLMQGEAISSGNLTMSYEPTGLSGLITLSEAGSLGALIVGIALVAGLVFIGVKSLNQSKVELKYWK